MKKEAVINGVWLLPKGWKEDVVNIDGILIDEKHCSNIHLKLDFEGREVIVGIEEYEDNPGSVGGCDVEIIFYITDRLIPLNSDKIKQRYASDNLDEMILDNIGARVDDICDRLGECSLLDNMADFYRDNEYDFLIGQEIKF
tara:strand:- start:1 stop:426 length:426 start_codon:yes stop_codon:yes gene_type:complete